MYCVCHPNGRLTNRIKMYETFTTHFLRMLYDFDQMNPLLLLRYFQLYAAIQPPEL